MKKQIMNLIFVLAFTIFTFGQTVKIQLVENGKPVASQKIKISSATVTIESQTDSQGNLQVDLSDGQYLISYSDRRGILNIRDGKVESLEITEVVVISANLLQSIGEVSKTVNIINASEIKDRGEFNFIDSLRTLPGFRIQQLGGFGRLASIKTRGLRNQDTAILLDGVRFRDAASINGDATAFLADITLGGISRLEVMRGAGSSLYGTNAIGGTIDLQTIQPAPGRNAEITFFTGGYGLNSFQGRFGDGNEKFAYNLNVSRLIFSKGIDGEDDAHNANVRSRIEFNPMKTTNISARFFISDAYVRLNSSPDTIGTLPSSNATIIKAIPLTKSELKRYEAGTPINQLNRGNATFIPDVNDPDNNQKSKFFNAQLAFTKLLSNKLILKAFYSGLKTSRKNNNGPQGIGFQSSSTSIFDGLIQTVNARLDWNPTRVHEITIGYEFEHEKYANDGFTPNGAGNFFTRAYQTSNAFFAQDIVKLLDGHLTLSGGLRVQLFDLAAPKFSRTNAPYQNLVLEDPPTAYTFDGSASYLIPSTRTKLRIHVGNGYRVPSLYERFGTFFSSFSQSFTALGDPDLKPERALTADAGIEQSMINDSLKFSATYFYTKLIETIGFGSPARNIGSTTRPFGGYFNTKGGIARGVEFSTEAKITNLTSLFASYTYTNSDQRQPQVAGSGIIKTLAIPEHQFTLLINQRIKNLLISADFLATSSYLAPIFSNSTFSSYVYRFEGNRKLDATASYEIPSKREKLRVRIFGSIENLLNQDYYENGFRTFARYGRAGITLSF